MSKPTREQIEVALQFADQRPLPSGHVYAATLAAGLRATEAENRRLREHADEMADVLEPFLGSDIEPEDKAVIWQTIAAYRGGGRE